MKPPRPRRHRRALETLGVSDAIAQALAANGLADEVRGNRIVTEWADLVGPRVASRTRADTITHRTLWIEVASSAWLHELNLMRPQLEARLRERLGSPPLFDEVKFRLAGRTSRDPVVVPRPRARPVPAPRVTMPATGVARESIVREVQSVEDADLRELIARIRITHDR